MARGPPKGRRKMELQQVFIIRWDKAITWPDGQWSNMCARGGTYEEVEQFANEIAEKYGLKVEVIV